MDTIQQLRDKARALREEFEAAAAKVSESDTLQALRDRFVGRRSGALSALLKSLGGLAEGERREAGQELNALKAAIEQRLEGLAATLELRRREEVLRRERLDTTLPGRRPYVGRRHPLTVVREELEDIFVAMGYEVYDGPEIEDDYHNFEALNMPPDHPARDMQDTFYLEGDSRAARARAAAAADAHLVRADPLHAGEHPSARGADHLPRQDLSPRQRRHAHADVPAGRGPGRGPGDQPRATSRARSRRSCTRSSASSTRCASAPPSSRTPSLRSRRTSAASSAAARASSPPAPAASARRRAGSRSWAPAW